MNLEQLLKYLYYNGFHVNIHKLVITRYLELIQNKFTHLSHGGGKDSPETRAKISRRHTRHMLLISILVRFKNTPP
jgi:hypothetical protein